ncbi:molybdenum cofactor guanylyltransferase [Deinococcus sp.]|uniref:molybdenum cofactor guanylyltransferase n=1 Tax=Deinococcus sp. TaxID=47478 RepID=UPI002869BF26|nr:molybdenum cofactor guanylyltransferase [Deinococcus sp.]
MITAAITAGGQSSRYKSDKALAVWQGKTLLEHVAASLKDCPARLLIAPPGKYALDGWTVIPDTRPGQGPLAGLEAALMHAPTGWVAFAGVDTPQLTWAYWQALAGARTPDALAVLALDPDGRPQPLAALYHTDLRPHITALLDAGERRLRLAATEGRTLLVNGLEAGFFRNVNRPGDLPG